MMSRRRISPELVSTMIGLVLIGAAFALLWPTALGGKTSYVIVSGESMEPTYDNGDLVILRRSAAYDAGDIVAFQIPTENGGGGRVIHRIVGGSPGGGYVTQGDNRDSQDPWRPTADDVVGQGWIRIPNGFFYLATLRSPFFLASLTTIYLMYALWSRGRPDRAPDQAQVGSP